MEGTERAQPVHFLLNRIVYQSCRVLLDMEGTERAQPVRFWIYTIIYESCRVLWTRTGLSEPSLFTFVLTGLFTSLVGCFGQGRD